MRSILAIAFVAATITAPALARDTEHKLPIQEVLNMPDYQEKVGSEVKFYFGGQTAPATLQQYGEFITNKKTNSANKSDEEACRWAMLSALITLNEKALQLGGNAVIGVQSYYKKKTFSSASQYECHAGAIIAGVALKGTVVKLK